MKHKIGEQITAVAREIALRKRVYPKQVQSGKMRQNEANYQIELMRSVEKSLYFLKDNEAVIRAAIDVASKPDEPKTGDGETAIVMTEHGPVGVGRLAK